MKFRPHFILSALALALAGSPGPARACTSFAAFGGERPWYGMNFDYAPTEITLALLHHGDTSIFLGGFGSGGRIAAMNDRGLYSGLQLLYYNQPQSFTNAGATVAIGDLCEYAVANLSTVAEVVSHLAGRRVVRSWNLDSHSLFADPLGGAMVVDPFGTYSGITPARDGFLVMTNLPNYEFLNQDYTTVSGAGRDRYITAYEYVRDHLPAFGYHDAMETLRRTVQSGGSFPTQVSFVFDPTGLFVYACFGRDFSRVWRVSLTEEILETYSGFATDVVRPIGAVPVRASDLAAGAGAPSSLHLLRPPANATASPGSALHLDALATGTGLVYRWNRNGDPLPAATRRELEIAAVQPADAGLYVFSVANSSGTTEAAAAIVGIVSSQKVVGGGRELRPADIPHPNGNIFDQVLLTGPAASVTADAGQVTRTSFVDLDDDIVQVEFSGPGTLTIVLDGASGPAAPVLYNQRVEYMKGHAGLVITGATKDTHLSVFSVGRDTAIDQSLFRTGITYDGIADLAFVTIASTDGKFGGLRTANANYFSHKGFTGVYAPGVEFTGPVYVGNVSAFDQATPVLLLGGAMGATRVTGGDLDQPNHRPVQVRGISRLEFTNGRDSHGNPLPARGNRAILQQDGLDITGQIVAYPK